MTARGSGAIRLLAIGAVAAVGAAGTAIAGASHGRPPTITVARGHGPAGGTFRLLAHDARRGGPGRVCFGLERRVRSDHRKRAYRISRCFEDVPARRALHGVAAYSCYVGELEVVGTVARSVARVDVELSNGRRVRARLYRSPWGLRFPGSFFVLIVRTPANSNDDMHPAAIRAFDEDGRRVGRQTFHSGGAFSWGCTSVPPPAEGPD